MKIETIPLIATAKDIEYAHITYTVNLPDKKDYKIAFIMPEANISSKNLSLSNGGIVNLNGDLLNLKFLREHHIPMGDVRQYQVGDIIANCIVLINEEHKCQGCTGNQEVKRGKKPKSFSPPKKS